MAELRVGYFEAFHYDDPALVLWGDEAGLDALASLLVALGEDESTVLTDQPWVQVRGDLRVTVALSREPLGLVRERETPSAFCWTLSRDLAREFVEKVHVVAEANHAGHHYLETDTNEAAVVMVSKGEYDHI